MKTDRSSLQRSAITIGLPVEVIRKEDQRNGKRTRGIVKEILTNSPAHPHGIKVRLTDGNVGRVAVIIGTDAPTDQQDIPDQQLDKK